MKPPVKKRIWLTAGGLVLLAAGIAAALLLLSPGEQVLLHPASPTLIQAAQGLDTVTIDAAFEPESHTLTVTQQMKLTSRTEESRDTLVLRAYANAFQSVDTSPCATEDIYDACYPDGFSVGSLVMEEATVTGSSGSSASVAYRYTDEAKTVLALPLPSLWQKGESLTVSLRYTVTLPHAAYRFGYSNGIYAFGNALLLPARWENGAYRTEPYEPVGDPFLSDVMNFSVQLSLPKDMVCAAGAAPITQPKGNRVLWCYDALAVRDFAFVISDGFQCAQAMEGEVLVSVYAADPGQAQKALGYARNALRHFSERFGDYPYQSFTVAEIIFPYSGAEYPGLVMISGDSMAQGGQALDQVIAHETAHQWWYAVVGSDQVNHAWMDEALCQYSVLGYVAQQYGSAARDALYESTIEPSMRVTMPRGVTPGAPLSYFSSMSQYATLVYDRGTAMLCALDTAMDGQMDSFLRTYYQTYAFGWATRDDFISLLQQTTGQDYEPLLIDYLDTYIDP